MNFTDEKDPGLIPQILSKILDSSVNGITLADPDLEDITRVCKQSFRKDDWVYNGRSSWKKLPFHAR